MDLSAEGLEPSIDGMRTLMTRAVARVLEHIAGLPEQRASNDGEAASTLASLREPIPEVGSPYEQLLDLVFGPLTQMGLNCGSAGALSYIQGGGLLHSAVADLISGGINPYVAYSGPGPGFAQLEQTVIRWFADLLGLPTDAGGVLLSGGSMANFSAIVSARCAHLGEDFRGAVLYASDQVHHSIPKGAMLAGLPSGSVTLIASNARGEIEVGALAEQIAKDRASGRRPFLIVATAGTTNTGAVDDLPALADLASQQKLWLHVDGAYGGLFAFTARGKARIAGIERADSVVLNPHKTLFLPYGTGCLLVRDTEALRRAHLLHADYIHAAVERSEALGSAVNFADLSPELSRDLRGLRIWLPLKLCGAGAFRAALDEKLDLAILACEAVQKQGFEVVTPPSLSTFTFRASAPNLTVDEQDGLNRRIMDAVNRKGRVHLSATKFRERFTLRICVLSFRTHAAHIQQCAEDLGEALRAELARR